MDEHRLGELSDGNCELLDRFPLLLRREGLSCLALLPHVND